MKNGKILGLTILFIAASGLGLYQQDLVFNLIDNKTGNRSLIPNNLKINYVDNFTSIWNTSFTSSGSSNSSQIKLPLYSSGVYNFTIFWGDGTNDTILSWNQAEVTHNYNSPSVFEISISGELKGWKFNNAGDRLKIIEISKWGKLTLGNSNSFFYGSSNLNLTAKDAPDLSITTDLTRAFMGCTNLGNTGDMNNWDVSKVGQFNQMFQDATTFNQPIGNWVLSSVWSMTNMFNGASSFNQSLAKWDVSNNLYFGSMFENAVSFNQPLNDWKTSRNNGMESMFQGASSFNQPLSNWDVSRVSGMPFMFYDAVSFDQDLSSWNIKSVTDMSYMFINVNLSTNNYDSMLIKWSQIPPKKFVNFDAGFSKFSKLGESARNLLVNNYSWSINDGGLTFLIPSPITSLNVSSLNNKTILNWSEPSFDGGKPILSYNIYRSDNDSTFDLLKTVDNNTFSFEDKDLVQHMKYFYVITATNSLGESQFSNTVNITFELQIEMKTTITTSTSSLTSKSTENSKNANIDGFMILLGLLMYSFVIVTRRKKILK